MKKIHHATRRAIIRNYERDTLLNIAVSEQMLFRASLRDIRLLSNLHTGTPDLQVNFLAMPWPQKKPQ